MSKLENIPNGIKPEKMFFEALIIEILDLIVSEIIEYSYHSDSSSSIFRPENTEINSLAEKFFLQRIKCFQRIYTLNYDSVIENIFKKAGILFSDGFQNIPKEMPQDIRHLTPSRIYLVGN